MTKNDLIKINKISKLSMIYYISHYSVLGKRIEENEGKIKTSVLESLNIRSRL
jgi:hypothetical protein